MEYLKTSSEEDRILSEFNAAWSTILDEVIGDPKFLEISESLKWLEEVLEKNVPFGKKNRAMLGIRVYRYLKPERENDDDFLSYVLGWCAEIACCLIADDIMDGSKTRRGVPCWYTVEGVGLNAVNDAFMLENLTYYLLDKYFSQKPQYLNLLRHMQLTSLRTILGQSLDSRLNLQNFENFTQEKYEVIVKYKTTYYSFHSPIACAMMVAGIEDDGMFKQVEELVIVIGYLFQVQDDYLDCFGDPNVTGKVGTDIQDGKCTWLIVTALKEASNAQKQIIKKFYGKKCEASEREIRKVYYDLGIRRCFRNHETDLYRRSVKLIKSFPPPLPRQPLMKLLNSIYRREK